MNLKAKPLDPCEVCGGGVLRIEWEHVGVLCLRHSIDWALHTYTSDHAEEYEPGSLTPPNARSLSKTERDVLSEKFAEHEISDERKQRQERFREQLQDSDDGG